MLQVNQLTGFGAGGGDGSLQIALTIAANTQNYDIRAAALAAGWSGLVPVILTLTVNSGVLVGSTSAATPGLRTGAAWPTGSRLKIVNRGSILGSGGSGGPGSPGSGASSGAGGDAFLNEGVACEIDNAGGTFAGGGGGGGGGGSYWQQGGGSPTLYPHGGGGGGGRGYSGGAGGSGASPGASGAAGGSTAAGSGGAGANGSGGGGAGGGLGQPGSNGFKGGGNSGRLGGSGGAAGRYAVGNSFNTWTALGTRLGGIAA